MYLQYSPTSTTKQNIQRQEHDDKFVNLGFPWIFSKGVLLGFLNTNPQFLDLTLDSVFTFSINISPRDPNFKF